MRKAAARATLIGAMLGAGLLYAGISQAQDANLQSEREAELAAATGGPAPAAHLIAYEADKAAVDVRDEDVAPMQPTTDAKAQAPASLADATPSSSQGLPGVQTAPSHR